MASAYGRIRYSRAARGESHVNPGERMSARSGTGNVAAVDGREVRRQLVGRLALARRDDLAVEPGADDELDGAHERRVLGQLRVRHRRLQQARLRLVALGVLDDRALHV